MKASEQQSKRIAGEKAVEFVNDGMLIGLGTGSTVYWAIQKIGQRVKEGLKIRAVSTSSKTEKLAEEVGIPLITYEQIQGKELDLVIDGADEISSQFNMIKGGGGALLREKLVALSGRKRIYIVDSTKLVQTLGSVPLPIEIVPFGWENTMKRVSALGCQVTIRSEQGRLFVTDNRNYILDCKFTDINDPFELHQQLKLLPGVIETGLFIQFANMIIVGYPDRYELLDPTL